MRGGVRIGLSPLYVLLLLPGFLAGCASTSETTTIQENLSILNQRQAALEAKYQNAEASSKRGGDNYARMEELQKELRNLNGRIEQLDHRIDQLQRTQASAPPAPPPQTQAPPSGPVVIEEEKPQAVPPRQEPRSSVQPEAPGVELYPRHETTARAEPPQSKNTEQAEFDKGIQLIQQKKYDAARKELQGFLSKYPKSSLEEAALYNIGECYYTEKHYEDAIKAYQQVVDKFPQGGRTASALLKEGMGWQQMGETTMARIIYTRLVEKFPGTSQAKAAQKKMQQM